MTPPTLRSSLTLWLSPFMAPNQRMGQTGRGCRFASGWHHQPSPGKFCTRAAAPQVMRGR